jgi:hypothetical protein
VPTSVLLAVLAAAGLLALAPALVRRYDATERLVAERALSTARVLTRAGMRHPTRRRTVPGRHPVNPPRVLAQQVAGAAAFAAGVAVFAAGAAVFHATPGRAAPEPESPAGSVSAGSVSAGSVSAGSVSRSDSAPRRAARSRLAHRRRRALLILFIVNVVEAVGAVRLAPAFWIPLSVTGFLLVAYVIHLRNRVLVEQRRRRAEARYAQWAAARQAAIRRQRAQRAAARRELLERHLAAREEARRAELRDRQYRSRAASR